MLHVTYPLTCKGSHLKCRLNSYIISEIAKQKRVEHYCHYTAYAVVLTKYCLNHCARTCCSLRIVTRCRFTNWRIRCERGSRNVHFLSINLISFRRSRGIVLVMASPAREMDTAGRQWNTEKHVRNVRDFSVKRLPNGGTRSCMRQQTRYAGVCADWEQKLLRVLK